jgi:putative peptidoglycan lipid II flippase
LHAQGAYKELTQSIEVAVRHILFWAIPATVFVIVLRAQIVRTILGAGAFDWSATRLTAAAFALLILALAAQSLSMLIARSYYAVGNTKKPLYFGCANIVISIASALGLLALFREHEFLRVVVELVLRVDDVPGTSILMLALGLALGSIAEAMIGYVFFAHDFAISSTRIGRLVRESITASVVGGFASYLILTIPIVQSIPSTTFGVFLQGLSAGVIGICVSIAVLVVLKNEELLEAFASLARRFRPRAVAVEPSDIGA